MAKNLNKVALPGLRVNSIIAVFLL